MTIYAPKAVKDLVEQLILPADEFYRVSVKIPIYKVEWEIPSVFVFPVGRRGDKGLR